MIGEGEVNWVDQIGALKENNYSIHLSINDYYIFIKRNKTKNNDKQFYQELLKLL